MAREAVLEVRLVRTMVENVCIERRERIIVEGQSMSVPEHDERRVLPSRSKREGTASWTWGSRPSAMVARWRSSER